MVIFVAIQLIQTLKRGFAFIDTASVFRRPDAVSSLISQLELLQDIVQIAVTRYLHLRRHVSLIYRQL